MQGEGTSGEKGTCEENRPRREYKGTSDGEGTCEGKEQAMKRNKEGKE